jgi:hypothetical protein
MPDPPPDLRVTQREAAQLLGVAAAAQLLAGGGSRHLQMGHAFEQATPAVRRKPAIA